MPYLPGEQLIVNSRCIPPEQILGGKTQRSRTKKKREEQIVIHANETVTVKDVYKDGDLYKLDVDWLGHNVELQAFDSYVKREQHLRALASWAKQDNDWRNYFDAKAEIADLRSNLSMTAHSSQGSTFGDVYLNLSNLKLCYNREERKRLLYVAVTRASGTVHVTGSLD